MARTVNDVITAVRGVIQDQTKDRYQDFDLILYVSEAVAEARRIRPDMFASTLRDPVPFYTLADVNEALPLPDFLFPQVVNYVAGRADLREDQFSQDGRAMGLISAFGQSLLGR